MDLNLLSQLEQEHGLTPGLLKAVMMQESGGKADAVSPRGAKGWFQFMPKTAAEYGVQDPTNFEQSARGAAKYLQRLHGRFGNTEDALRAYNWGQGNLADYKKGVRKDMPPEAQNYPAAVLARMDVPDLDNLPDVDLPDFDALPNVDDEPQAAPKSEKVDWQAELENLPGTTLLPTLGSIGGSIVGGAATAPTVVGTPAGVAAGGTLGAMGGYFLALRNSEAPAEEKAKFLLKKFNWEAITSMFGASAANKIANMLAKTPAEKIALDKWFQQNGSNISPITDKALSGRAGPVYQEAVRKMDEVVNESLGQVMRDLGAGGGSPTQMGKVFQEAYKVAKEAVNQQHRGYFVKYDHGTTYGDTMVTPTKSAIDLGKRVLRNFKDTEMTQADAGAAAPVVRMVEKIVSGKAVPVAEMINMKRALANTADWDKPVSAYDNTVRKEMSQFLDESIEAALTKVGPDAIGGYRTANRVAHRQLEIMTDNMITKMASSDKTDPMYVAEFVAKNATPTSIQAYKKALGLMANKGALTAEQNEYLMDNVRRNWIEMNMKNGAQASKVYDAILGGRDAEAADVFNALFNKSGYKPVIEKAAKAAHAIGIMSRNIPGHHGVAGEYAAGLSVASTVGGQPAAAATAGGLWLLNVVPRALAKSALRNDKMIRNKVNFVVNWMNSASPDVVKEFAKGTITAAPPNVVRAYTDVEAYLKDE